jgi:hypothetical protein
VSAQPVRIEGGCFCGKVRYSLSAEPIGRETFRFHQGQAGDVPLTYRSAPSPGEIDVATATLDDPGRYPPTHHSWLSHNVAWVTFGDGLPTYPKSRGGGA